MYFRQWISWNSYKYKWNLWGKKKLENEIPNFLSTELEWVPLNLVSLTGISKDNMIKFLEALDDDDDVQNIFTNAKFEN